MGLSKLLKFASVYLICNADLTTNMAMRIMHSLIPTLVANNPPKRFNSREEAIDYFSMQLLPGAREILQLGSKAIVAEYALSYNEKTKRELAALIGNGRYREGLELAANGFEQDFKTHATGGKRWKDFSLALLRLQSQIEKVEKTGDPKEAKTLSAYLNTIDGMVHNSGDFLERFVQQESGYLTPEKTEELRRLRDISRLERADDVVSLMRPYAREDPEYWRLFQQYQQPVASYQDATKALQDFQAEREMARVNLPEVEEAPAKIRLPTPPKPPRPKR